VHARRSWGGAPANEQGRCALGRSWDDAPKKEQGRPQDVEGAGRCTHGGIEATLGDNGGGRCRDGEIRCEKKNGGGRDKVCGAHGDTHPTLEAEDASDACSRVIASVFLIFCRKPCIKIVLS
jgi:hypothetical protein